MYKPQFVYPFIDRYLDYFHLLAMVNNAATNIHVHVLTWILVFNSFGYVPRSEITDLYGNSMPNILRNSQTVFHSVEIILHSH